MNGKVKFLFFCMIFVGGCAFAQDYPGKLTPVKSLYTIKPVSETAGTFYHKINTTKYFHPVIATKSIVILNPVSYSLISPDYYTQNFGFFCKKELQVEKLTKIPFKFRLGSVQQCDWMEGKMNAGIR